MSGMSTNQWKFPVSPKALGLFSLIIFCLLWLFVAPFFQKAQLSITLDAENPDYLQIFWNTDSVLGRESGYLEEQSVVKRLRSKQAEYNSALPSLKNLKSLRIDPSTKINSFTLYSITIFQAGFEPIVLETRQTATEQLELHGARFKRISGKGIGLESFNEDPQLILNIQPAFSYVKYVVDKKIEYSTFIAQRMDLLGLDWSGFLFLSIDILLLLSISATVVTLLRGDRKNSAETCVFLGLTGLAVILFSVMFLGMTYLLNWKNLLTAHAGIWILLHGVAARAAGPLFLKTVVWNFQQIYGGIVYSLTKTLFPAEYKKVTVINAFLLASILFLLLYYIIPAAFTLPLNFDSNDYRLSRIGHWLQEANIWQFPSNDIRQIIMPPNCDLAMLWITSFFKKGYPLVHLISFFGGLLVCCSIYAVSKALAFSRTYCLIAVLIWLGIPNSASQMLTSQTDLFTTGCLMAGLYCFYQAIFREKHHCYAYAGIGIGLSVGAKSTVFLWGPGLLFLCLAIIAGRLKVLQWKVFGKGILLLTVCTVLSGGFVYGQNALRYHNFLGPSEVVESIDVSRAPVVKKDGVEQKTQKMSKVSFVYLRAQAYLWQIFEPSSNLTVIRPMTDMVFDSLEEDIYKTNENLKASFVSMYRAAASWLRSSQLSEDYVSFGFVAFSLLFLGGGFALVRSIIARDAQSLAVTAIFISVLLYMMFFCWIVGWTVHRYRYAVLVTPFLAVTGMYFLSAYSGFSKKLFRYFVVAVTSVVVLYQVAMAVNVATNSRSHGWFAFRFPEKVHSYVFYWRDAEYLTDTLPENIHRLGLVLSKGSWKSMFYRIGRDIVSYSIPVNDAIDASHAFLEEKNVDALITKNLSSIIVADSFNILSSRINTYQALIPVRAGEYSSPWIISNGSWSDGWVKLHGSVRVGNWKSGVLSLDICNPAPVDENITLKSSVKQYEILLKANSECEKIDIPVNNNDNVSWRITPGYHPWKNQSTEEIRSLGVKIKFPKPE